MVGLIVLGVTQTNFCIYNDYFYVHACMYLCAHIICVYVCVCVHVCVCLEQTSTIIRINFIRTNFVLEIFVQQYFHSYQTCTIYSQYIILLVNNFRVKNFHRFAQNENF